MSITLYIALQLEYNTCTMTFNGGAESDYFSITCTNYRFIENTINGGYLAYTTSGGTSGNITWTYPVESYGFTPPNGAFAGLQFNFPNGDYDIAWSTIQDVSPETVNFWGGNEGFSNCSTCTIEANLSENTWTIIEEINNPNGPQYSNNASITSLGIESGSSPPTYTFTLSNIYFPPSQPGQSALASLDLATFGACCWYDGHTSGNTNNQFIGAALMVLSYTNWNS